MKQILVVEADTGAVKLIQQAFLPHADRISLMWAASLREAQQKLAHGSPDLVIAAAELPDGPGQALVMLGGEPQAYPLLILSTTDQATRPVSEDRIEVGYLLKTVDNLAGLPALVAWVWHAWEHRAKCQQAQAAMKQNEARLLTGLMGLMDGFVMEIDHSGTILNVWTANDQFLVRPKTDLIARNIEQVFDQRIAEPFMRFFAAAFEAEKPESIVYPLQMPVGDHWFLTQIIPIAGPDNRLDRGWVLFWDQTSRRQMERDLNRRTEALTALAATSLAITTELDLPGLLGAIVKRAAHLLSASQGILLLVRPAERVLEVVALYNQSPDLIGHQVPLDSGLSGTVVQHGEPRFVANYATWPDRLSFIADDFAGRILSVPLPCQGQVIGVLKVLDNTCGDFDRDEIQLLSLFAAQAALAIEKMRLLDEASRRAEQLGLLCQVSHDLTMVYDLNELLDQIVNRVRHLIRCQISGIALYRPEPAVLTWTLAMGLTSPPIGTTIAPGEGLIGQVWLTGEPIIIDDYQNWPGKSPIWSTLFGSAMGVPIRWRQEKLGVLMAAAATPRAFLTEESRLLGEFADQAATAIQNTRLHQQMQQEITERKRTERLLQAQRDTAVGLLAEVGQGLTITDGQGRFEFVNPAYARMVGLTTEALIGQTPWAVTLVEDHPALDQAFQDHATGRMRTYETRLKRPDGTLVYTLNTGVPRRDQVKVVGAITVITDLTEYKKLEASLRASEEALQHFQERLKALHEISLQLTEAERFEQVCRLAVELARRRLGFDRAGLWLIDETDRNLVLGTFGTDEQGETRDERAMQLPLEPPEGTDDPMLREILYDRRPLTYRENWPLLNERLEIVGYGWSAVAALWDGSQVVGFLCTDNLLNQQPISPYQLELLLLYGSTLGHLISRHRAAARVRESEERFHRLFDLAPIGMALTTLDGYYLQVNPAFCQTVGYPAEELIGRSFAAIIHPDDLSAGVALIEQLLQGEIPFFQVEKRYIAKGGQIIHVLLHATLRYDADRRPINLIGQIVDITPQKQVEAKLKASLKEKELLLKEVHHRVKNNLQVVSSLLALQADYSGEAHTHALLQESQHRVRSMALVHEQLYQAGDLTNIDFARYLRTLIAQLGRAYQPQAKTVTLTIVVDEVSLNIDRAIPCGLIVNELVSNALKHAFPAGQSGQIEVRLETNATGTRVKLTVADTGIGMPTDVDFKATDTLGLQLVNILTQQLKGSIELDRGQGTAFTVEFPIVSCDPFGVV